MTHAAFSRCRFFAPALILAALSDPAGAQTLKPPLSNVGWLLGTWSCSGTVSVDGKNPHNVPASTFAFSAAPGGSFIVDKEVSGSIRSTGRLYFNGHEWIDDVEATSPHGASNYTFTGEDVDVGTDHVDLKGTGSTHGVQVGVRLVRHRTGDGTFHEASYLSAGGVWHQIEDVSCKRK